MSDLNPELKSWHELMQTEEDLLPELQDYYEEGGNFPMVRHPLVFSVPHSPQQNAMLNEQYRVKLASVEKAFCDNNFGTYIALHERAYRLDAFKTFIENSVVGNKEYWSTLADIYTDSENIYQNYDEWVELLSCDREFKRCLMNEDELETLYELPEKILVFRGYKYGDTSKWLSWSIDYGTAKFFADRFVADGHLASGYVDKNDVIAYFNARDEDEILVKFEDVQLVIMKVEEV